MKKISRRKCILFCCMCICSLFLSSCFSIPGEKEAEERNIAASYYELGVKYTENKQYDKAVSCFQKAREKAASEDINKIDYQIARSLALSNKWNDAAAKYEELLELDPENTTLKEAYAYVLYKSGEKEKALQLYAELYENNPENERIAKNYEKIKEELTVQEAIGS